MQKGHMGVKKLEMGKKTEGLQQSEGMKSKQV